MLDQIQNARRYTVVLFMCNGINDGKQAETNGYKEIEKDAEKKREENEKKTQAIQAKCSYIVVS